MKLGYARVSTTDQDISIQRDRLYAVGCEKLFEEKTSGVRKQRPVLERLLVGWRDPRLPGGLDRVLGVDALPDRVHCDRQILVDQIP